MQVEQAVYMEFYHLLIQMIAATFTYVTQQLLYT